MAVIVAGGRLWTQQTGDLCFRRGYAAPELGGARGGELLQWLGAGPVVYRLTGRFPQAFEAALMGKWLPAGYWGEAEEEAILVPWHLLLSGVR